MVAGKEATPQDRRNAERLRRFWATGQGAARIQWGVEGDFRRCVINLSKHMADAEGYCAKMHHDVLGYWPGDRRNKSGGDNKKKRGR